MRRLSSVLTVAAAVPALVALPALTRPAPHPHPVTPHLTTLPVTATRAVRGVVGDTGKRSTSRFDLVGATWRRGALRPGSTVQVRTRSRGHWSGWTALTPPDGGPDAGSADAVSARRMARTAAEPIWVGDADGVQARVVDTSDRASTVPAGLHVVLVDGGSSAADASPGPAQPLGGAVAAAAQSRPTIYTRAQWGADESLRLSHCPSGPSYSPTITMGFIHHTDGVNGYTQSQVPSIIRSIYAYHVKSNGWCDIGYNFLIDRFGRIWEGRYGGITRAVIGAHTGGYNYDTFGVSLIGTYSSTAPSRAMLAGTERLFAWKFGTYYLNPAGNTRYVAGAFSGSRYAAGTTVTFHEISGHRNADYTACPGNDAYADLSAIRSAAKADMGAGLVAPSVSPARVQMYSGHTFRASAQVLTSQTWTMTVANAQGTTVRELSGSATPSAPISRAWDLTDNTGAAVPPGTYTVTLSSQNSSGVSAVPYSTRVTVTPPVTVKGPASAPYKSTFTLTGTAVPGASVDVHLTDTATNTPAAPRTVQASSTGKWSTTFVADHDWSWTASVDGYTTRPGTTKVAPALTSPRVSSNGRVFVAAGGAVSFSGTALPGTHVSVVTQPVGGTGSATSAPLAVASDGTWRDPAKLRPTTATSFFVRDGARGVRTPSYVVYPVGAPSASAPATGWSGRWMKVSGNAGRAPVTVSLYLRLPGSTSYTLVKRVTAGTTGGFGTWLHLPVVTSTTAVPWKVATGYGSPVTGSVAVQPAFAPTAKPLRRVAYDSLRALRGTAVPGEVVTVWTRPATSQTWTRAARVRASSTKAWSFAMRFRRDTSWRATSRSGTSPTRTTHIVPTIHGSPPGPRSYVHLYGRALPHYTLTLYRQPLGATTWRKVRTVRVSSTGRWSTWLRPTRSFRFSVVSHHRRSRALTIKVG